LMQVATCKVAYVTPAHQYPTGVTLSLARRLQLLGWARHTGAWIIEDDYDGEYRYSSAPLAPLAALDPDGRVLYIGTFGKVAFPALRLGYRECGKPRSSVRGQEHGRRRRPNRAFADPQYIGAGFPSALLHMTMQSRTVTTARLDA